MGAERDVARDFTGRHSCLCLEPLPKGIDQAHQRDRRLANLGCQFDKVVKGLFRLGIENVVPTQCIETRRFVLW
ncbi:MAG: hypothetical protein ABI988_14465 [Nitrospirota bacterium]